MRGCGPAEAERRNAVTSSPARDALNFNQPQFGRGPPGRVTNAGIYVGQKFGIYTSGKSKALQTRG